MVHSDQGPCGKLWILRLKHFMTHHKMQTINMYDCQKHVFFYDRQHMNLSLIGTLEELSLDILLLNITHNSLPNTSNLFLIACVIYQCCQSKIVSVYFQSFIQSTPFEILLPSDRYWVTSEHLLLCAWNWLQFPGRGSNFESCSITNHLSKRLDMFRFWVV